MQRNDQNKAAALAEWDINHVWHPFTQHDEWEQSEPLIIEGAEGVELIDVHGKRYLDGVSSLWTNVHGHRVSALDEAVRQQLERVAHSTMLGLGNVPSIELARKLSEMTPGDLNRTFYSDSGSTATEVGIKIAFQYQQQIGNTDRTRFAAFAQAYHGDTIGSVSVGGIDLFHEIYRPLLFDAVHLPVPDRADPKDEEACLDEIANLLAAHSAELAGLIFEPLVQGAAGMRMHSPDFLRQVLTMCREAGIVLIADEVATGFGRTGTMFAMEQVGVVPDILCLAKGLSGGYLPLAATVATDAIFDAFRGPYGQYRTFFHGHTYTGNPLACAAALANLELFENNDVIAGLPPKIAALEQALATLPDEYVAERRQRGLMAAALVRNEDEDLRRGHRVCIAAREHGAIVRNLGDALIFMPALAMEPDDIRRLGEAVGRAMADVMG